jgi:hypothetical protein
MRLHPQKRPEQAYGQIDRANMLFRHATARATGLAGWVQLRVDFDVGRQRLIPDAYPMKREVAVESRLASEDRYPENWQWKCTE